MNMQTISKILAQLLKKAQSNLHRYFVKKINRKNTAKKIARIRKNYKKNSKRNASKQIPPIRKNSPKNASNILHTSTTDSIRSSTLQSPLTANRADTTASQNPAEPAGIPALNVSLLTAPSPITQIPTKVLVRQPGQPETTIGWWLTVEMLNELIGQFLNGYISRLALSWDSRELVLLHNKGEHDILLKPDSGTYACLFFDNKNTNWYALVSLPEVYAVVESQDVVFVPFGLGTLPNYMVHDNTKRIKEQLNEIVAMVANPHGSPAFMTWAPQCYRFETYPRYHIAKRLYGGYSAEQEPCRLNAKFYIPTAPNRLAYANCAQTQSNYAYKPRNKSEVQEALVAYIMGKLSLLILSWHFPENNDPNNGVMPGQHIILVQDQGCHQMLYLDKQYLCYLVSDVSEYINAEGNHYRKTVFNGQTVPAYTVHENLYRIRDYTDLLLAQIEKPNAILNLFGEFSYHEEDYDAVIEEFFEKEKT